MAPYPDGMRRGNLVWAAGVMVGRTVVSRERSGEGTESPSDWGIVLEV